MVAAKTSKIALLSEFMCYNNVMLKNAVFIGETVVSEAKLAG